MKLSEFKPLSVMNNNETLERPVYLVSAEDYVNKAGKNQVNMTVKDGINTERVSIFDADVNSLQIRYPFMVNGAVIVLRITKKDQYYNAIPTIVDPRETFDLAELAEKATDNDPMLFYNYILDKVSEVARNEEYPIARIVKEVYEQRKDRIIHGSSAIKMHHTGLYGNLVHTAEVVQICKALLRTNLGRDIDAELLLSAAALHDVGKLDCYTTDDVGVTTMSFEGYALGGHHYDSLKAIDEIVKSGNYDAERVLILKNIIASHHES